MDSNSKKNLLEAISADERLINDLKTLPQNYNFEVAKTIWKIQTTGAKTVALQFPEGLTLYACLLSEIVEKYTSCETIIMGDVTYGACCLDDFTAIELGCDLLVHYGHSCLVPIQETRGIDLLYVFVGIKVGIGHLVDTLLANLPSPSAVALVSTIQFVGALQDTQRAVAAASTGLRVLIPQCKPLSPGEVLGCTAPRLGADVHALVYVGDGRFHLEAAMMQNPSLPAYQYDPYTRRLSREHLDSSRLATRRRAAVDAGGRARTVGLVLGTLGRQGNPKIFDYLQARIVDSGRQCVRVLLSEIFPGKLAMFPQIDCWVQVACPRLSTDWGDAFAKPILTSYEMMAALGATPFVEDCYPMDYYANESAGPWTNNHPSNRPPPLRRANRRPHVSVAAPIVST